MSKKDALLTEGQVRQFMKLAALTPLTPGFINGLQETRKNAEGDEELESTNQRGHGRGREPVEEGHGTKKGEKKKTSSPGRGEKKGDKAYVNERARRARLARALLEELGDDIHLLEGPKWDAVKGMVGRAKDKLAQAPWVEDESDQTFGGQADRASKKSRTREAPADVAAGAQPGYGTAGSVTPAQVDAARADDLKHAKAPGAKRFERIRLIGNLLEQLGMEEEELGIEELGPEDLGPEELDVEDLDVEELPLPPEEEELGGGQQVSVDDFLTALEVALEDVLGDEVEVEQEEELGDLDVEDVDVEDVDVEDVDIEEGDPLELQEMVKLITRRVAKRIVREALNKK